MHDSVDVPSTDEVLVGGSDIEAAVKDLAIRLVPSWSTVQPTDVTVHAAFLWGSLGLTGEELEALQHVHRSRSWRAAYPTSSGCCRPAKSP